MEEDVGFEPTDVLPPLVFKTSTISHSVNLPYIDLHKTTQLSKLVV